ncbi:MAG: hypothetical protein AAGI01_16550 [Myxococcota bacterium]
MNIRHWVMLLVLTLALASVGCGSAFLKDEDFQAEDLDFRIDPESEIPNDDAHRELLEVFAEYRRALVRKDFGTLNRIIADVYYENAGTTSTTRDDYGHEQLPKTFEQIASHAETIQYQVTVKSMTLDRSKGFVDYEYRYAYQYKVGEGVSWDAGVDVNRVEFRKVDGAWKIVNGL